MKKKLGELTLMEASKICNACKDGKRSADECPFWCVNIVQCYLLSNKPQETRLDDEIEIE